MLFYYHHFELSWVLLSSDKYIGLLMIVVLLPLRTELGFAVDIKCTVNIQVPVPV